MAREYTCKVLALMDEGVVDAKWLAHSLLNWLSEDDVREFAER